MKSELVKLIPPPIVEQGCINFDMHQDDENPAYFLFFGNRESRELWLAHMK